MAVAETVVATRTRIGRAEAVALARRVDEVVAVRGSKVVRIQLADRPDDEELAAVLLGPTGNLRAPTLRVGPTLLVGFHAATYADLLT